MGKRVTKEDILAQMRTRIARLEVLSECAEHIVSDFATSHGGYEQNGPDEVLADACRRPGSMAGIYPYEIGQNGRVSEVWDGLLTRLGSDLIDLLVKRNAGKIDDCEPAWDTMPGLYAISCNINDECKAIDKLAVRYEMLDDVEKGNGDDAFTQMLVSR